MAPTKQRGDLAELKVAGHLISLGYGVAFPYGEDCDFDLVLMRGGALERVQVKHCRSRRDTLQIKCYSHSLTNGKVRRTKRYTSRSIDWIAAFDPTTDRCFYVPSQLLGDGRSTITLRLGPTRNGQVALTHDASKFESPEAVTQLGMNGASGIRTHDLPDANRTL